MSGAPGSRDAAVHGATISKNTGRPRYAAASIVTGDAAVLAACRSTRAARRRMPAGVRAGAVSAKVAMSSPAAAKSGAPVRGCRRRAARFELRRHRREHLTGGPRVDVERASCRRRAAAGRRDLTIDSLSNGNQRHWTRAIPEHQRRPAGPSASSRQPRFAADRARVPIAGSRCCGQSPNARSAGVSAYPSVRRISSARSSSTAAAS